MARSSLGSNSKRWMQELERMLQLVCWALCSTVNSTTKHTPGQLAFSRDMITQARVSVDWDRVIRTRREKAVLANERENSSRTAYAYQEGEQVLVKLEGSDRGSKLNNPYEGPYEVVKSYGNGTIKIDRGAYTENLHIRRVKPYKIIKDTNDTTDDKLNVDHGEAYPSTSNVPRQN